MWEVGYHGRDFFPNLEYQNRILEHLKNDFSMQVAFYIIPNAWKYKRLTSNQLNMNIAKIFKVCERAER